MRDCRDMRPLIDRVAEGEAGPEEALALGRHLPECTVCRILLAKAHRLNEMVNELGEPIEVDESFLRGVMDALPDGTPQEVSKTAGRSRRHLRVVKLLVSMSPLGLLGAGRSMFLASPETIHRVLDSGRLLPVEGRPDFTASIREIVGIGLALAGKLGLSVGDLNPVKPVVAFGVAAGVVSPALLALSASAILVLALFRPLRMIRSRRSR